MKLDLQEHVNTFPLSLIFCMYTHIFIYVYVVRVANRMCACMVVVPSVHDMHKIKFMLSFSSKTPLMPIVVGLCTTSLIIAFETLFVAVGLYVEMLALRKYIYYVGMIVWRKDGGSWV